MKTALSCIGLLALLIFGLGLAISMTRRRTKTSIGYPDDPTFLGALGTYVTGFALVAALFLSL